ncbi:MAG: 30S ribosomal protein S6 [Patescibacteria group bacterium UBA2103]
MADTEAVQNDEISVYEAAFHIDANLSETEVKKTFDGVKEVVANAGGTLIAEALPERMNLAYTISSITEGVRRDHNSAHFAWVAYELSPEKAEAVQEELQSNKAIIRHLITTTTKEEALYAQDRAAEKMSVAKAPESEEVSDEELDEVLEETTA